MGGTYDQSRSDPAVRFAVRVSALLPGWRLHPGRPWTSASPEPETGPTLPDQGWKLHLSATPRSAPQVIEHATRILGAEGVPFKFATDARAVQWLGGRECDREASGKVVTSYPRDDEQARDLAHRLDQATAGLPGPRILSDRPLRPGSLVHYRYGGFTGLCDFDNDGVRRFLIRTPDGETVPDHREAWFDPPDWAANPFETGEPPEQRRRTTAVRLNGRYVVRRALRHSSRGGVYDATDDETGREVVIKHARAHVESDVHGDDARTRLLHEARMLRRLDALAARTAPSVPAPIDVFAAERDLFLVEGKIHGVPLQRWVSELSADVVGVPADRALPFTRHLAGALRAIHDDGLVMRDLSPANILVGPGDRPAFVDMEAVTPLGEIRRCTATPGYRAPELTPGTVDSGRALDPSLDPAEAAATIEQDLYSLGGILFLLATGTDPMLAEDSASGRPDRDRLAEWLGAVAEYGETARLLRRTTLTLLSTDPAERLPARDGPGVRGDERGRETASCSRPPQVSGEVLRADALAHLLATATPDADRLWPSGGFGSTTDPCNVQHGAAGVLAILLRATSDLDGVVRKAAAWLDTRAIESSAGDATRPNPSPGLYFGRGGTSWVLADAGRVLDEPQLLTHAVDVALSLPTDWPSADVTHGLAGALLAHLRVADVTRDSRVLGRARTTAATLATRVEWRARRGGPLWRTPHDFDSRLAGTCHYGFAHGVAGIGYALLAAGVVLDEPAHIRLATEAGDLLCRVAHLDADGSAWWPVGPDDPTRLPHWCSGSSGIGTFLVRLFAQTGDERFAEYARAAAGAVYHSRWRSSAAACHGLAGDGQFLLDVADHFDDGTYRVWAEELTTPLAVRACRRNGLALVPDETGRAVVADYNTGLAGVVAFLSRLHYGGSRPFMLDDLMDDRW